MCLSIHPTSWAYTEEGVNKREYDEEKAKKLLDEAGVESWFGWNLGKRWFKNSKPSYFGPSSAKDSDLLIPIAQRELYIRDRCRI